MKHPALIDRAATALTVLGAAIVLLGLTRAAVYVAAGWVP